MVADRLDDGVRIAQLLASEVTGNEGRLRGLGVTDADPDAEPTADGALAYRIVAEAGATDGDVDVTAETETADGDATVVAEVYVQPDRVRIEARVGPEAVAAAAASAGLRTRPKATRPPRTLVFVEDGAGVKRALTPLTALRDAAVAADSD